MKTNQSIIRLEGPLNIPSFNKIVKCSRHGKMCTMVCMNQKCADRTLCTDCIVEHTHSHLARIIPLKEFNANTNVVPSLVQREIVLIRSQILSLQNQLITAREARKAEYRSIVSAIKQLFAQEIQLMEKEGSQLLERYFNRHTSQISQQLYVLQNHLNTLSPYLANNSSPIPVTSMEINTLLSYQESLIDTIIPQLQLDVKNLSQNVLNTDIFLNNTTFLNNFSRNITESLNVRLLFTQNDPIKAKQQWIVQQREMQPPLLDLRSSTQSLIDGLESGPVLRLPRSALSSDQKAGQFEANEDPELMKVFTNHLDVVNCVCLLDNTRFASAGGDKTVKIWNLDSGYQLASIQGHLKEIWALAKINPMLIASASADLSIRLWSLDTLSSVKIFHGHADVVKCLCYCPDKQLLASGCIDSRIKLWNTHSGQDLQNTLSIHHGMVRSLTYIELKGILISASSDNLIKATRLDSSISVVSVMTGHYGEVNCVCYLYERGEESFIASGGQDKIIIIWCVEKAVQLKQFRSHFDTVNCIHYSSKHDVIISGSTDRQIIVWSKNGKVKNRLKLHSGLVSSLAYSERRNVLLSAGWDHHVYAVTLKLFDDTEFN